MLEIENKFHFQRFKNEYYVIIAQYIKDKL